MMARGRGGAIGDYGGWKFNVDKWAKGRTFRAFRAGDVLGTYIYLRMKTDRK